MDIIANIIRENIGAFLAILGGVIGALLSFWLTWITRRRESRLRLTEKMLDKTIEAHEEIFRWSHSLSAQAFIGHYADSERTVVTTPKFMVSWEMYNEWGHNYFELLDSHTFWLSVSVANATDLLNFYLAELTKILASGYPENLWIAGVLIADDFNSFMLKIQNACYEYLSHDLPALKIFAKRVFSSAQVKARRKKMLTSTQLITRREMIEQLVKTDPGELEQKLTFTLYDRFKQHLDELGEEEVRQSEHDERTVRSFLIEFFKSPPPYIRVDE